MGAIPVDYPLWDWNSSNGNATAEQTIAAYTAATTKGLCEDFSRLVWNDIIDTLNELLVSLGMEWDDTYTTLEDAKILVANGPLMGPAFNSVRYNIEKAAFTTWRWEFDFLLKDQGYVGRNDFRGVSLWGMIKADKVYGWYIIELTRKLNVLIELMRGTWPTEELLHVIEFKTSSVVDADSLPAISMPFVNESKTSLETLFKVIPLINVKGNISSESDHVTSMLARRAVPAKLSALSESDKLMKLCAAPTKVMGCCQEAKGEFKVKTSIVSALSFPSVFDINTKTVASFKASPWLAKFKILNESKSTVRSSADIKLTKRFATTHCSKGEYKVNLWAKDIEMLDVVIESLSRSAAVINQLEPLLLGAINVSKTKEIATLADLPAFAFTLVGEGSSFVESNMSSLEAIAAHHVAQIGSSHVVKAVVRQTVSQSSSSRGLSKNKSRLVKLLSVVPCVTDEVVSKCEAEFTTALVTSASVLVKGASSNEVDLFSAGVVRIKVVDKSRFDYLSKLTRLDPLPIKGNVLSEGSWCAKIHYVPPTHLKAKLERFETDSKVELAKSDPIHVSSKNIASTNDAVKVVSDSARVLSVRKNSETRIKSSLGQITLQNQKAAPKSETGCNVLLANAWDPPIWVGDGLWFRQLYDAVQIGDALEVI